jgi:signal peptidase I
MMCQEDQTQDTCQDNDNTIKQKKIVLRFIIKLVVVIVSIWAVFTFVFGIRRISGEYMYPRLRDGDLILYYRLEQNYSIGDVVTFKVDDDTYTCRIVAQGGDVVDIDDEGELLVNGNVQQEEIFYPTQAVDGGTIYPYTVEEDSYFVLCDYRTIGCDSRAYGTIPRSTLDGKIITVLRRRGI